MTEATGGYGYGRVRYTLTDEPRQLIAYHYASCQRRYGTAFGMSLFHDADALNITQGELKTYVNTVDSGRKVVSGFWPECGTQIYARPEWRADTVVIRARTLDNTKQLKPDIHIWTRSRQDWVIIPEGVPTYPQQPPD
jgi:hypothetical protein